MSSKNSDDVGEVAPKLPPDEPVTSAPPAPPDGWTPTPTLELVRYGGTNPEARVEQLRSLIAGALAKSVAAIIEAGRHLKNAKEELGVSYRELVAKLPISISVAANLIKIAEKPALSNRQNWDRLPYHYNTLYHLTLLDDSRLTECIASGAITPELTIAEAKALRSASPQATNDGGEKPAGDTPLQELVQIVLAVPKSSDRTKLLKDLGKVTKDHDGVLDLRKSSLGEWTREATLSSAISRVLPARLRELRAAVR